MSRPVHAIASGGVEDDLGGVLRVDEAVVRAPFEGEAEALDARSQRAPRLHLVATLVDDLQVHPLIEACSDRPFVRNSAAS